MTERERVTAEILEMELGMFLSVRSERKASCQDYPESFKLHRRAQFSAWSHGTLASYLDDLRRAQEEGDNLMTYKYARMQNLIPRENTNPLIDEIVRIHFGWQEEMFRKFPAFMGGARPISEAAGGSGTTSFETYLKGELESYSDRTLELLHADMAAKLARGVNMSEEVYEYLARESGYSSLAEAERTLAERRRTR